MISSVPVSLWCHIGLSGHIIVVLNSVGLGVSSCVSDLEEDKA